MKKGESKLPIMQGEMIEVKKPRKVRPLSELSLFFKYEHIRLGHGFDGKKEERQNRFSQTFTRN